MSALGTRKSWILVCKQRKADTSGCEWTLAVLTSKAAQSSLIHHELALTVTVVLQLQQLKKSVGSSTLLVSSETRGKPSFVDGHRQHANKFE